MLKNTIKDALVNTLKDTLEKDLKIPNMRGIMQARTKPLNVLDSESFDFIQSIEFSKPNENKECIFVDEENVAELVKILNEKEKVL